METARVSPEGEINEFFAKCANALAARQAELLREVAQLVTAPSPADEPISVELPSSFLDTIHQIGRVRAPIIVAENIVESCNYESIQAQLETLDSCAVEEILAVENKYNKLRKPCYEKRAVAIRKLPNFWFKVLTNNDMLSSLLTEADRTAFSYLTEITVEDRESCQRGFAISLRFATNPFFNNEVLMKDFYYDIDGKLTVSPSQIDWKRGMDLSKLSETKEVGKRGRTEEQQSFFVWFNPEDQSIEIGEILKEEVWPDPYKFYKVENEGKEDGAEGDKGEDDGCGRKAKTSRSR